MSKQVIAAITATILLAACTPTTQNNQSTGSQESTSQVTQVANGRYQEYSLEQFAAAADKKRVLFFWAAWCPTCKAANQEITQASDQIPDDVIVFKTNYDTEGELKDKYGITYQHTFVLVDEAGNELKKWNGGGINEVIDNTR